MPKRGAAGVATARRQQADASQQRPLALSLYDAVTDPETEPRGRSLAWRKGLRIARLKDQCQSQPKDQRQIPFGA
eukprot:358767-Chlamydomonas_euryale.AAC.5